MTTVEMFEELSFNIRQWFCWLYANSLTEVCEMRDLKLFYLNKYMSNLDDKIVSVCFLEKGCPKRNQKHLYYILLILLFFL